MRGLGHFAPRSDRAEFVSVANPVRYLSEILPDLSRFILHDLS